MIEDKEELQNQVSQLIHHDIVKIATDYGEENSLNSELIITFVQDINLLQVYDVKYIHNNELNEIIEILSSESKNNHDTSSNAILVCFDYLLGREINFKQAMIVNLFFKVDRTIFADVYTILAVLSPTVKDLYSYLIEYLFNKRFLSIDNISQIDILYKAWFFSQQLFHDNEASTYAYEELKKFFYLAIEEDKEEVVFWLYYTPLHYYNSTRSSESEELNKKFKIEIEDPLEKYIENKIIPKYNLQANLKKIDNTKKIKVAFVMQRIVNHSTVKVLYPLIKVLSRCPDKEYEFVIYDLNFPEHGGSNQVYIEKFKELGIKYIDLHSKIFANNNPIYSLVEKCIKTRDILIKDEVDILIGLHTRVEYMFLYKTRTAPKQVYWYHNSNDIYNVEGIDLRIAHGSIPKESEYKFSSFEVLFDYSDYSDTNLSETISKIKNSFEKETIVLGSIGRLIKLDNDEYLESVFKIMKQNDNTIYLACGSGDKLNIEKKVKNAGLLDRFFFIGFIEPRIYGKVIDIYLNTFPLSSGESLNEYISMGGVPVILLPKEHLAIQEIFKEGWDKKYERIFSFDKEDYILLANNLIRNKDVRDKLAEENINRKSTSSNSIYNSYSSFLKILDDLKEINDK